MQWLLCSYVHYTARIAGDRQTDKQTDRQTEKPSTVTLAVLRVQWTLSTISASFSVSLLNNTPINYHICSLPCPTRTHTCTLYNSPIHMYVCQSPIGVYYCIGVVFGDLEGDAMEYTLRLRHEVGESDTWHTRETSFWLQRPGARVSDK